MLDCAHNVTAFSVSALVRVFAQIMEVFTIYASSGQFMPFSIRAAFDDGRFLKVELVERISQEYQ